MLNRKSLLIVLFWIVVLLSAIYLRTAIYRLDTILITIAVVDVVLLIGLSWISILALKKTIKSPILIKVILLILIILVITSIRFYNEGFLFNFLANNTNDVVIKFVLMKLLSSTVIFGITLGYYTWERLLIIQKQKLLTEIEKKQMELDFMKSRVNPHFLFNTLGSIHSLALSKSDKTALMIEDLSDLMRYMFYDCQEEKISLKKEIEFIKNYISLNQQKSNTKLNIDTNFIIENENIKIEPLLFISFIENIFKHGDIFQGGNLKIEIIQTKAQLLFSCKNSYLSENKQIENNQSGFGIKNIKNRLTYLYGNAYGLNVDKNDTYNIELLLKLEE